MSADSREELEYRLEFVLNEIMSIKTDMFNTELTSRMEDYIRDIQEELNYVIRAREGDENAKNIKELSEEKQKIKEDLDEKLVIISNLQRDHENTAKMLDEHLEIYRKRADYIDRKMDDIISATEKKNQILFTQLDKTEAKIQTIKDGNLAYIGDRLQQSMLFFIKQGFTNRLAQMNIHRMFEAYKAHDGNSWIAEMYEEYKQVPLEEDMEVLYEKNS